RARARQTWAATRRRPTSGVPWRKRWREDGETVRDDRFGGTMIDARRLLLESFEAAVAAADPLRVLEATLPTADEIARFARTRVVGAGKAAASMAIAVERHWPLDAPLG